MADHTWHFSQNVDQFGLYRDSPKTEEVNIESTPLFGPVKFTTPPGRAWDRMANALVTSRLLDQLVQNPLWELRKTTHLIVYAISLESLRALPLMLGTMEKHIERFFSQVPVLVVLTHYKVFVEAFKLSRQSFASAYPSFHGDSPDDAVVFVAKEILSKLRPFTEAKVRLGLRSEDRQTVAEPQGIKCFDETTAYRVFAQTCPALLKMRL